MKTSIHQAMILAAGLGTRMQHLTADRPKAMVEVAGRPLIDHVIDKLIEAGIRRIIVNLHYHADVLQSYLAGRTDVDIVFSDERGELLDTGGGIRRALPLFDDGPLLTHNCDTIWAESGVSNLRRLIDGFDAGAMDALMLLARRETSIGYDGNGDFERDSGGRLSRRGTATVAPFVWAGVQIIQPDLFAKIEEKAFSTNIVLNRSIENGRLFGIILDGTWMHVGTPEAVIEAEECLASSGSNHNRKQADY